MRYGPDGQVRGCVRNCIGGDGPCVAPTQSRVVCAKGKLPENGADAQIEYMVDMTNGENRLKLPMVESI